MFGLKLLGKLLEEAVPEVYAQRCVRKFRRATCDKCSKGCPTQAIQLGSAPRLEESRCVGCGVCCNVCPTGAFVSPMIERLSSSIKSNGGRLACSRAGGGARNGVEVPCLGMLSEGLLIAAALGLVGRRTLSLDVSHCDRCELTSVRAVIDRTLARANSVLTAVGSEKAVVADCTPGETQVVEQRRSRRDFLNYLRGQALQMAAESVDSLLDETRSFTQISGDAPQRVPIKYAILQRQIEALMAKSVGGLEQPRIPLGRPLPPEKCEFCNICAAACPSRALEIRETADDWELLLELRHCVDCRACADVCPTNGLRYDASREALQMVVGQPSVLVHATKIACASCGCRFPSWDGNDLCPSCKKGSDIDSFFAGGPAKQLQAVAVASEGKER